MKELKEAIVRTLCYADVFDYPLTSREIYKFLITSRVFDFSCVQKQLREMSADGAPLGWDKKTGFYFLIGREVVLKTRLANEKSSGNKLKIAQKIGRFLRIIPSVKLVGVTGKLAMENANEKDDIDFLIITAPGVLWLTRFFVTALVELSGRRRRPEEKDIQDKICLNMFLSEDLLAVPKKERDLYTAHEVVQMKPLWDRDRTYEKFLKANQWVRDYLPNATPKEISNSLPAARPDTIGSRQGKYQISDRKKLFTFERLAKRLQLWYMRNRRTTEVATDTYIRFHPKSARDWILPAYQKRLAKLAKISPLDKQGNCL